MILVLLTKEFWSNRAPQIEATSNENPETRGTKLRPGTGGGSTNDPGWRARPEERTWHERSKIGGSPKIILDTEIEVNTEP